MLKIKVTITDHLIEAIKVCGKVLKYIKLQIYIDSGQHLKLITRDYSPNKHELYF